MQYFLDFTYIALQSTMSAVSVSLCAADLLQKLQN